MIGGSRRPTRSLNAERSTMATTAPGYSSYTYEGDHAHVDDRAMDSNPETRGEIVLLHDSGGDRSATIEALPRLIHELRARGFKFVAVSDLAGLSRDQVMPVIPPGQRVFTRADAVTFFFGEDEAVADNGGPHHVSVPRSELVTLLAAAS